jgi:hypothetical protein
VVVGQVGRDQVDPDDDFGEGLAKGSHDGSNMNGVRSPHFGQAATT